jgi:glucose uptake protein GlcU
MCAGAVWSAGNTACIAAVTNPAIGLAVAMPIMQCGLFVAGIWGILLYKEIQGVRPLATYFASGAVLVFGAALLATSKQS